MDNNRKFQLIYVSLQHLRNVPRLQKNLKKIHSNMVPKIQMYLVNSLKNRKGKKNKKAMELPFLRHKSGRAKKNHPPSRNNLHERTYSEIQCSKRN